MDTLSLILLGVVALGSFLQGAFLIAVAVTGRRVGRRLEDPAPDRLILLLNGHSQVPNPCVILGRPSGEVESEQRGQTMT